MEHELTIISAYHSDNSRKLLERNEAFARRFLGNVSWTWIAVDNTPSDYTGTHPDPARFNVIKGVPYAEYLQTLEPWQRPISAGYHHVHAIHTGFANAKTRFVLILDGDLYVVYPNWLKEVLKYMSDHQVAMFGTPWHPRWWKKVRYYPIHHGLFIDTALVPLSDLDFYPKYQSAAELSDNKALWLEPLMHIPGLKWFAHALRGRLLIGSSKDASYAVYLRYKRSSLKREMLTPVLHPYAQLQPLSRIMHRIFDFMLPDRLSYTPRLGTYITRGFKECGYPDADGMGWEEFMWRGKPFGFHMRSYGSAGKRSAEESFALLDETLAHVLSKKV